MVKILKAAALTAAVSGLAASATAQISLYSQPPHVPGAAGADGLSCFQGGLPTPPPMYDREIADDFAVPGAGWTISNVSASFIQNIDGDPDAVTGADIQFYINNGGTVGPVFATATVINTTVTNGPGNYFGRTEKILSFDVSPVVLPAGGYFVKIQPIVNHNWFWLTSDPTTPISGSTAQTQVGPLNTPGNDVGFPVVWTPTGPANPIFPTPHDENFTLTGQIGGGGPTGACCITASGACVITNTAGCTSIGGVYHGDGSDCATTNCPQPPMGACCLPNLTCTITYAAHCTTLGGTYQGDNTTCGSCPLAWQEQGDAGELPSTAQFVVGTGSLPGIIGTNGPADTDMYAINISDASTFTATTGNNGTAFDTMLWLFDSTGHGVTGNDDAVGLQSTLTSQFVPGNGLYYLAITQFSRTPQDSSAQGLWNSYTPEQRPNGPGAANPVAMWTGATGGGGAYTISLHGASYIDPSTIGACCLPDGSCGVNTSAGCTASSGIYRGNGSVCANANCPQPPTGACCTGDGCSVRTQAQCTTLGGTYHGDNSTCAQSGCPQNLVCNGGFENGAFGPCWTQFGDTSFTAVNSGNFDGITPHGGTYEAHFGPTSSTGGIQQTVNVPAGTMLTVDFWYAAVGSTNSFSADLGGTNLVAFTNDTQHTNWSEFTFMLAAPVDNPVLSFTMTNPPAYDFLDDIRVTSASSGPTCYANCDHSTNVPFLNVNDFICFQTQFAAGTTYANCDQSTIPPVLNVNDFICFQTKFAAGCSAP